MGVSGSPFVFVPLGVALGINVLHGNDGEGLRWGILTNSAAEYSEEPVQL